jgi:hypothetical protein
MSPDKPEDAVAGGVVGAPDVVPSVAPVAPAAVCADVPAPKPKQLLVLLVLMVVEKTSRL